LNGSENMETKENIGKKDADEYIVDTRYLGNVGIIVTTERPIYLTRRCLKKIIDTHEGNLQGRDIQYEQGTGFLDIGTVPMYETTYAE